MVDNTLEISMGGKSGAAVNLGDPLSDDSFETVESPTTQLDTADLPEKDEDDDGGANGDAGTDGGDKDAGKLADGDGEAEEGAEGGEDKKPEVKDLGAFDPEKVADWDAHYTKEGELDFKGVLSQEFFARLEAGKEGLNEGTYAYLAAKGIPQSVVKDVEAMAVTQRDSRAKEAAAVKQAHDLELMTLAATPGKQDGPDNLRAALNWGKDGGYSEEDRAYFNKVMEGDDLPAKKAAVKALLADFSKAGGAGKPRLPKRDATKGQGNAPSGVQPYKSRQEWRQAMKEAGGNARKEREVAARLAVSRFE